MSGLLNVSVAEFLGGEKSDGPMSDGSMLCITMTCGQMSENPATNWATIFCFFTLTYRLGSRINQTVARSLVVNLQI